MDLNCCKSWGCENFGLPGQPDYEQLSHHLGYPALHCKKCGSYPPRIDNTVVEQLCQEKQHEQYLLPYIHCPVCSSKNCRRYGFTSSGRQRYRCRHCHKVFSPSRLPALAKLMAVLDGLEAQMSSREIIQQQQLNAKSYYHLLQTIAQLLGHFTRHLEQRYLPKTLLAMQTDSGVIELSGGIRLWAISSAEAKSGYQLMLNHNGTRCDLTDGLYQEGSDNRLDGFPELSLTEALKQRYKQTMDRYHFEYLQYGSSQHWKNSKLIEPWILSYAHFQLLSQLTVDSEHQHHYMEQESCIRAGAIMGSIEAIQQQHADLFYLFAHPDQQTAFWADGRPLGWWKDRWFSSSFGGYCPITERRHYRHPFQLRDIQTNQHYFNFLAQQLPKAIKSIAPLQHHLMIQRCCYNFTLKEASSPAIRLGMPKHYDRVQALLQAAYESEAGTLPL